MASFGWKRKVGEKVSKSTIQKFEAESEKISDDQVAEGEVDWMHAIKRRREVLLEDCATKSKRLKDEGSLLAEQGRHWEAVKKWDEAIQLTPDDPLLYEMKSQVLTLLQEVFPAVQAAEMAVKLRPLWWEGWQTLGRAQLSLGEVDLAVRSFQVALHQRPSERPLWEEDLGWARGLQLQQRLQQRRAAEDEAERLLPEDAPELQGDYDFESDEVLEACAAAAERHRRRQELRRTTAATTTTAGDAPGDKTAEDGGSGEPTVPPEGQLVKARGR